MAVSVSVNRLQYGWNCSRLAFPWLFTRCLSVLPRTRSSCPRRMANETSVDALLQAAQFLEAASDGELHVRPACLCLVLCASWLKQCHRVCLPSPSAHVECTYCMSSVLSHDPHQPSLSLVECMRREPSGLLCQCYPVCVGGFCTTDVDTSEGLVSSLECCEESHAQMVSF